MIDRFIVWLAQGFGLGRFPYAPGTFGSVGGLVWFAILISSASEIVLWAGIALGVVVSVGLGGSVERLLQRKDPRSVVIDEVIAVPLCFAGWAAMIWHRDGNAPELEHFFGEDGWWKSLGIIAAFRVFDIWKPWPLREIQNLPAGWGLTADDVLAAVYVNGCVFAAVWAGVF